VDRQAARGRAQGSGGRASSRETAPVLGAERINPRGQQCPDELVGARHPTVNDPGGQARGVRTGGDNVGHVERRQVCEQLGHASLVPHPDSSRLGERELDQEAPVDRRAARRSGGTAQVVRARELDRESVQPGAGDAKRGSRRRLGVLAQPTKSIHTDSVPATIRHQMTVGRFVSTSGEKTWPPVGRNDGRSWGETDGH
jgi:hypothetical protein